MDEREKNKNYTDPYNGIDPGMGWDESEQDDSKDCCGCCEEL